jgi:hypothetical protein
LNMRDEQDFDLNLLPVVLAVAEERSVSRAAERLGWSQPKVSIALNKLRAALGDPFGGFGLPALLSKAAHLATVGSTAATPPARRAGEMLFGGSGTSSRSRRKT